MIKNLKLKVIYSFLSVAVYCIAAFFLYPQLGDSILILGMLPVMAIAWLFGAWTGFFAGIVFFPLNAVLIGFLSGYGWIVILSSPDSILDSFVLIIIGVVVGGLSDLYRRMSELISERDLANTALKESEYRYRDLFENANDLIQCVDTDGKFLYVNRKWRETLGYSSDDLKNMTSINILRKDQIGHCMELIKKVIEGESLTNVGTIFVSKTGKEIFVEGNTGAQFKDGKFVATRSIFRDVSERKRNEERIQSLFKDTVEVNEKLKKMDKTKDEFLSIVTHDLKSPLVSVLGYADIVLNGMAGKISDKQRSYVEIIKKQGKSLQEMIDTILDYTRMEFGKTRLAKGEVPINLLIADILKEMKPQADKKGLTLEASFPKEDIIVSVDKGMINRVIINLLTNAIKYTPEKGKIEIALKKAGQAVEVTVQDNGIGIPKPNIPLIFDKFHLVDETQVRERRSLGLGLSIAKHFVESHGGNIRVESEGEGKGSKFIVSLPLDKQLS